MSDSFDRARESLGAATHAMKQLVDTFNAGVAKDIAQHPDLAELNVQMDGYYEPPTKP